MNPAGEPADAVVTIVDRMLGSVLAFLAVRSSFGFLP
jgi:hypothetical protein